MERREKVEEAAVVKRGEICIQVSFKRSLTGLNINTKIHPSIETLIRSWGDGEDQDVKVYGRNWFPPTETTRLRVWNTKAPVGYLQLDESGSYRIDIPGAPLFSRDDRGGESVNLSFLRLVGASEGAGVGFGIRGVFTLEAIRDLAERVQNASRRFYISYMRPIDLTVMVSTQEMRG